MVIHARFERLLVGLLRSFRRWLVMIVCDFPRDLRRFLALSLAVPICHVMVVVEDIPLPSHIMTLLVEVTYLKVDFAQDTAVLLPR